jgi:hypothetical protein
MGIDLQSHQWNCMEGWTVPESLPGLRLEEKGRKSNIS